MGILVWGFGNYYSKKEKSFSEEEITAFVSGKETGMHKGTEIIRPEGISKQEYDKLFLMAGTRSVFEILEELKGLGYREWDKVVPGWNVEPYTEEEAILSKDGKMVCNSEGVCVYLSGNEAVEVHGEEEWKKLRQRKVRNKKRNAIAGMPLCPVSRTFGLDRGQPVDRYFIEKFLRENAHYIRGTVLEVAEREYTVKFGTAVEKSHVMHVCDSIEEDCIIANLETGEGVMDDMADCFILTQTLPFIFDVRTAAENIVRFLKSGGVALITVPGITQISRYDMDRWGHYWSFTTASLKRLFGECRDVEYVEVNSYGNMKSSAGGLYGLAAEDMEQAELEYRDDDYQQIVTTVVRKGRP